MKTLAKAFVFTAFFAALPLAAIFPFAAQASNYDTPAKQALLLDANTGTVLYEKNADEIMYPASMTKMMTAYLVFERLKEGGLTMDTTLRVSKKAWKKGGSKMFVLVDTDVAVRDLLHGIIVQSGNDACIVVAEGLAGTEENFAKLMTSKAKELGMHNTQFRNSTGWPDTEHYTTARDLAILAKAIINDFPEYYSLFNVREFTYAGIKQDNRNPLLYAKMGADGLKTGHTEASGYGVTGSSVQGDRRLVMVVNGMESTRQRAQESRRLMSWGFANFVNYQLFSAGETVHEANLWLGKNAAVPLMLDQDLTVTLPIADKRNMKVSVQYDAPIPAPVRTGDVLGKLIVDSVSGGRVEYPLHAAADVEKLTGLSRITAMVNYLLLGAGAAPVTQ